MRNILTIIFYLTLFSSISFAQQINIYTSSGTDTYNLADIDSITFTVLDTSKIGTVTDIDGNVYKSIKIGNQWWMAENLKVTKYRNGDAIPDVWDNAQWASLNTGAYCNYNNDAGTHAFTYGRLYNGFAISDSRNIAPEGWHVPTDEEWQELEMYLGMSQSDADGTGWRGTDEGGKLKETGTGLWQSPNTGATNESGFSALPGGYRDSAGPYREVGTTATFWSSTRENNSNILWRRILGSSFSQVDRGGNDEHFGFSVRCVRD